MHATIASTASASFYFRLMAAFVVAILALLALVLFGSAELVGELTREGGPVETMAAAGYLVAIATFFREGGFAVARARTSTFPSSSPRCSCASWTSTIS